ncbi:hypothetical protein C2E21_5461 [Chlorella sorokiniana]|uniref:MYND-type domain-containing protein n=1 Tax=Chlorella sorokiniana TaxID=3076 RepID=A0A2P6TNK4_CHLSO|nr:hypothetical protein C2E21_5461 [Chlorella sorokiniana]|eukprot:PRW50921.1 hypothetical protein C2E21_5461 [Chlorella sorokiniana]
MADQQGAPAGCTQTDGGLQPGIRDAAKPFTFTGRVQYASPEEAAMVCNALAVDPELRPEAVTRELRVDGCALVLDFAAVDMRTLRAAVGTFCDLLGLATRTLEAFGPAATPLSQAAQLRLHAVSLANVDVQRQLSAVLPAPSFCLPSYYGTVGAPVFQLGWLAPRPGAFILEHNGPGPAALEFVAGEHQHRALSGCWVTPRTSAAASTEPQPWWERAGWGSQQQQQRARSALSMLVVAQLEMAQPDGSSSAPAAPASPLPPVPAANGTGILLGSSRYARVLSQQQQMEWRLPPTVPGFNSSLVRQPELPQLVSAVLAVANSGADTCPWAAMPDSPPVSASQSRIMTLAAQMAPPVDELRLRHERMAVTGATASGSDGSSPHGWRCLWAAFSHGAQRSLGSWIESGLVQLLRALRSRAARGVAGPVLVLLLVHQGSLPHAVVRRALVMLERAQQWDACWLTLNVLVISTAWPFGLWPIAAACVLAAAGLLDASGAHKYPANTVPIMLDRLGRMLCAVTVSQALEFAWITLGPILDLIGAGFGAESVLLSIPCAWLFGHRGRMLIVASVAGLAADFNARFSPVARWGFQAVAVVHVAGQLCFQLACALNLLSCSRIFGCTGPAALFAGRGPLLLVLFPLLWGQWASLNGAVHWFRRMQQGDEGTADGLQQVLRSAFSVWPFKVGHAVLWYWVAVLQSRGWLLPGPASTQAAGADQPVPAAPDLWPNGSTWLQRLQSAYLLQPACFKCPYDGFTLHPWRLLDMVWQSLTFVQVAQTLLDAFVYIPFKMIVPGAVFSVGMPVIVGFTAICALWDTLSAARPVLLLSYDWLSEAEEGEDEEEKQPSLLLAVVKAVLAALQRVETALAPCGHRVLCLVCTRRLRSQATPAAPALRPVCREERLSAHHLPAMSSILDQGIDKLERTLKGLANPQHAPELVLHLHGLRRAKAAAATLLQAAAAFAGPSPPFHPQMLPVALAGACPELFRGLVELSLGLAECQAASGSNTLPDGLNELLFDRRTGMVRVLVETDPQAGMTMAALDAREVRSPLAAVAAVAAYALVGSEDDAERVRCSWESLLAVMGAVWPDSCSPARVRALERTDFVPLPRVVAAAEAAAAGEAEAGTAQAAVAPAPPSVAAAAEPPPPNGSLAAVLAADLARYAPGVTLRELRAATTIIMAHILAQRVRLNMDHMRQLLVRVHDVHAGRAVGCFQLCSVSQVVARAGPMTPQRFERIMAYMDGVAAVAADTECAHAGFALAEQQVSICSQALQLRGRPELRWLTPPAVRQVEARGRAAVARATECVQQLKPWLQPHKLAREKARFRSMEKEMAAATRSAPAPDAVPRDLPSQPAAACTHCKRGALHLRKCAACRSVAYCCRECQVAHWKEGRHKRECKALAAKAQGGSSGGDGS